MEDLKPKLKRTFRFIYLTSPKNNAISNKIAVLQRITLEEARLSSKSKPRERWFRRHISLSVSEILEALVEARVLRKIGLLNRICEEKADEKWTNYAVDEYIESDMMYCQLTRQIQWLSQLEQMPIAMELKSFKYYVNQVATNSEDFDLLKTPSYLSTGIEEYFKTDSHFQKQAANQKLCQLVLDSHTLINGCNYQSQTQVETIREKLCNYLCKRHKMESSRAAVQQVVNQYVHVRAGMFV